MADDAECLRKYAEMRDEVAFSDFVHRNIDFVYSAAFRQTGGDAYLADDIVQTVFVAASTKAGTLSRHPVVGAWLYQATRYAAIDALRSSRRRQARELEASQMTELASDPNASAEWAKISRVLDSRISQLGERDRDAVILRYFRGKSFSEIGAALSLSEGAARMRVERALEKLRVGLTKAGITSSCAALSVILTENGVMAAPAGLGAAAVTAALGAPVTGGLAASFGVLNTMTSAKAIISIAAIATLAGVAASVHEYNQARVAEKAVADAARTHQADQARIQQLGESVKTSGQRQADLEKALQLQQATSDDSKASLEELRAKAAVDAAADKAASARAAKAKALADGQAFLAAYGDQARDMLRALGKAQLTRNYALLADSGLFTPEQMNDLETQTAELWMQNLSITPNSIRPGDGNLPPDQLQSILGEQGYQEYQNFARMQPVAGFVTDASTLSTTEPLSPQQSIQLLNLIANASSSYVSGGKADPQTVDWGQVLPQAQGILSPAQYNALSAESQGTQVMGLVRQYYQSQSPAK
jgi:RNA polymerase sigma factor (sigma-70 family)